MSVPENKKLNVKGIEMLTTGCKLAAKFVPKFWAITGVATTLVGSRQTKKAVFTGRPTISTVHLELSLAMNGFWKKRTVPETPVGAPVATVATVAVAIWKTPKLMRYLGEGISSKTCYRIFTLQSPRPRWGQHGPACRHKACSNRAGPQRLRREEEVRS